MKWSIAEAKNKLSEVLTRADSQAQIITRRERDYIIIPGDQYRKLTGQELSFTEFLIEAPVTSHEFKPLSRQSLPMRDPQL